MSRSVRQDALQTPLRDLRGAGQPAFGHGASACAIGGRGVGRSSMGLTPLEGLVTPPGTRSGDVDPGLFGFLHRQMGLSAPEVEDALYRAAGFLALVGVSDMREVEARAATGDHAAQLAINLYARRARKYVVGAYAAAMGGLVALVFRGELAEHSASMRRTHLCWSVGFLGLELDDDRNTTVDLGARGRSANSGLWRAGQCAGDANRRTVD